MSDPLRFSDRFTIRIQPELFAAVERSALASGQTYSEWSRQRLVEGARAAGFNPAAMQPRDAGALYDLVEGKRRYARIEEGAIKFMGYFETGPEDWLPVVHEDSEPFDIAKHWRLAPVPRIEPDRVVMVYPVVLKSMELV
jgi:hypothetical protein